MYLILVVLLVVILVSLLPPLGLHSYGPWPSGVLGVVVLVLVVLLLLGRL